MGTRKRISFITSEIVSSPDKAKQALLKEARELESRGHQIDRPKVRRNAASWFVSNPKGYDANLTLGEGTL